MNTKWTVLRNTEDGHLFMEILLHGTSKYIIYSAVHSSSERVRYFTERVRNVSSD